MREIKFRGKRLDNKEWVYGHYFITPITAEFCVKPENGAFFASGDEPIRHCIVENMVAFEVDPATIEQYTGLKDKNGKEIYEGDILSDGRLFHIKWDSRGASWTGEMNNDPERQLDLCFLITHKQTRVIGNRFDNPELLK